MYHTRIVTDIDEAGDIWKKAIGDRFVSDLWDVRMAFHENFQRPLHFVVVENSRGIAGFLPLTYIEEKESYGYFPGETWEGKTWLEQNRIVARNKSVFRMLMSRCPSPHHLRYLLPTDSEPPSRGIVDEVGYFFLPPSFDYSMEKYFEQFSHKSAKRIRKEVAAFEQQGVEFRYDELSDFDHLVGLNLSRFGENSYFHDERFRKSFESLLNLLRDRGWLRLTTVIIAGEIAAVDMGSMYRGTYTLLAGGTNGHHPGVAKLINLHHMERACRERVDRVDFLCGNFSWKEMFHLTPRPLYQLSSVSAQVEHHAEIIAPTRLRRRDAVIGTPAHVA